MDAPETPTRMRLRMSGIRVLLALVTTVSLLSVAGAAMVDNGDFETGDMSGWDTNTAGANVVSGSSALAGTYSALLPGGSAPANPDGLLSQSFAPIVNPVAISFLFSMPHPETSRGLNFLARDFESTDNQVNLRVVDLNNDGGSDVQIYQSGSGWQTLTALKDAVSYTGTNSFELTINSYGSNFDYDVMINGARATGLDFHQNSVPAELDMVVFNNSLGTGEFTIDDVAVSVIPEPATIVIWSLLAGLAIGLRRRRK